MPGKIIYGLVAKQTTVLAEHASTTGNFTTVCRLILEKIAPNSNEKRSYVYDRHIFHYIVENGLIFLCMADEAMARRIPFDFLLDIKKRWTSQYGDAGRTAMPYGMNEEFSKVLSRQMEFFSNDKNDKLTQIKDDMDSTRKVMVENIDRMLERGEKIELLVDKTDNLSMQAQTFKKKSTNLKRVMCMQNLKLWLIIIFVVLLVIYFITASVCGGLGLPNCVGKSSPKPPPAPAPAPAPRKFWRA